MNKKILYSILGLFIGLVISFGANADLDKAIAYAEAGEIDNAHKELLLIAEAAETGNPKALYEFGVMYKTEGYWIVQSDESAVENWLESAKLGYAPAQFVLGASYILGSGVEKDLSQAKYWLQQAIDGTNVRYSNDAKTIYNLNNLDQY